MNKVERYSYLPIDRVTHDDGTRFYVCPDTNTNLVSVTTIISATSDKTFLKEWRERVGEKEADRQSSYGKNLGSLVHKNIEDHIDGIDRPTGNAPLRVLARRMSQRIIDEFLPNVDEVWGIEKALYFSGISAGTCDLIGRYNGKDSIMDHKNAKKMRKREDIQDYFHQMAAYAEFHDNMYGTKMQQGVIFMVDRQLECKSFVIDGLAFSKAKDAWWKRVEQYYESVLRC